MLERLELQNFTAFRELTLEMAPGVNVFIGANATGKTHLLKVLYAALSSQATAARPDGDAFARKLQNVFLPRDRNLGRLVHRVKGGATARGAITRQDRTLRFSFSNRATKSLSFESTWPSGIAPAVYIPVKEMLANAPGFRSLYQTREIHFGEVYADIIDKAYLPVLRGAPTQERRELLGMLQDAMQGRVIIKGEQFFLKNRQGELEFTLLAEGLRKLALLWLLIQNGTLLEGATLFWDEPEANLNPALIHTLVAILLRLQQMGVQLFVATHSYVVLKEFELQHTADDALRFIVLQRDPDTGTLEARGADDYLETLPHGVAAAYEDIYDREVERALEGVP